MIQGAKCPVKTCRRTPLTWTVGSWIKQSLLRRQKGQCDNRWEVKTAPKCKNRICLQRISEVQVADVRNGTIAVAV